MSFNSINFKKLKRTELDGLDTADKYPESFHVVLNMELKTNQSPLASEEPWSNPSEFESFLANNQQSVLFNSVEEMNQLIHVYGI